MPRLDLGKVVPEKGVDYYTNADKAEMVAETKAQVLEEIVIPTKTSDLNNDSGFIDNSVNNLANYYKKTETYTKAEVDSKVSSVYKYKGSVATFGDLPSTGQVIGDVYNVEEDGSNYAWNGTIWDKLGGEIDLSDYYTKSQTDTLLGGKVDNSTLNNYYTKTRTDELLGDKEDESNKVTSISSESTDIQYPSAKCVYNIVGDIATTLDTINGEIVGGA